MCLTVPGGQGSVPEFLRAEQGEAQAGIRIMTTPDECGNAVIVVVLRVAPWDEAGVEVTPP